MKFYLAFLVILIPMQSIAEFYPVPEYVVYGAPASASDKDAIDNLMKTFKDAWSSQDAAIVASIHSSDANWTNAFGRIFIGSENLEVFLRDNLFPNYPTSVSIAEIENFTPISRRYIGSDAAVVHAFTSSNRGSALSGDERRVYFDFVIARTDDGWKIVHQTISDIREIRD